MKTCKKCKQEKPESDFYCGKNGLPVAQCKECKRDCVSAYRSANRDKVLTGKKKHYRKHAEKYRAATREWTRKNPDRKRETSKAYRTVNKERLRIKDACWRYGITPEEYRSILHRQGGKCAICGAIGSGKRSLHVDHSHVTGKVRGLLCSKCNTAIGMLKEDISLFQKAAFYLVHHDKENDCA